jgi:minichromosome maintenance protein 10
MIRLSRDGATYDLPVEGDWLTIAVVAERGEVKISGTKNTSKDDDDDDDGEEAEGGDAQNPKKVGTVGYKGKKAKPEYRKRPPRKYVNLKLCALPPRSRNGSSTSGDALLQLLLFEADSVATETIENEDGEKVVTKRYLGGSGGAYERWCNLTVGSVIAIMNPKILRPLRVSHDIQQVYMEKESLSEIGWISSTSSVDSTTCSQSHQWRQYRSNRSSERPGSMFCCAKGW